jgi:hypothetical protein
MNNDSRDKIKLYLSKPLAELIIINCYNSLFVPGTYARETFSWYVQTTGQEIVDLFLIVPLVLVTSILAYKQNCHTTVGWN